MGYRWDRLVTACTMISRYFWFWHRAHGWIQEDLFSFRRCFFSLKTVSVSFLLCWLCFCLTCSVCLLCIICVFLCFCYFVGSAPAAQFLFFGIYFLAYTRISIRSCTSFPSSFLVRTLTTIRGRTFFFACVFVCCLLCFVLLSFILCIVSNPSYWKQ